MVNTILFDLDGTLLPIDEELFISLYFRSLGETFADLGYHPDQWIQGIWTGTQAMVANDGSMTNEERFWQAFMPYCSHPRPFLEERFESYYRNHFHQVRVSSRNNPFLLQLITSLKERGYTLILATNPLFPKIATIQRMSWVGLQETDFKLVTAYENSTFAKPNLDYYRMILDWIGKTPEECLMVGNDVAEDMVAQNLGLDTFLVTDCLNNPTKKDIRMQKQGTFSELVKYLDQFPTLQK